MGDLVNLRRARKAKTRAAAETVAAANRTRFGRSRVERDAADFERTRAEARLEAHRRQPGRAKSTGDGGNDGA